MITRRDRFERVYAPTEAVAPASLIHELDAAEADDFLLLKTVAADGLTPMRTVATTCGARRPRPNSRRGASGSWRPAS